MAMKKLLKRFKLNNKGVSLVEVLVTVAIVAIVAAPLLNSFLNAVSANNSARIVQNGTSVAQDMSEMFKVFSVETMYNKYTQQSYRDAGVNVVKDETTGKYTFTGIKVTGADGEEFVVDVEVDPTVYLNQIGNEEVKVNDVNLPVLSSLHSSDSIMLYKHYISYDDKISDTFGNMGSDARKNVTKDTTITINCTYNAVTRLYFYDIIMDIKFSDGTKEVSFRAGTQKSYKEEELHSIYLTCPMFDLYNADTAKTDGGNSYGTDKIKVIYSGDTSHPHNLYFYIAEQDVKNYQNLSTYQRIDPRNLIVTDIRAGISSKRYTDYCNDNDITKTNLKLYSNIGAYDGVFDNKYTLTSADYNKQTALYGLNVYVKYEGKRVATVTTAR